MCLRGRMVNALRFSPAVEYRTAGSILTQPLSLWALISRAQIRLYVKETQTETLLSDVWIFMRFDFTQKTQV